MLDLKLTLGAIIPSITGGNDMYLENINSPSDIQKLNLDELRILADETRDALIHKFPLPEDIMVLT